MRLDSNEILGLAAFLARRLPEPRVRHRLALQLDLRFDEADHPKEGWAALIGQAQAHRRLGTLAEAVSNEAPSDPELQEVCHLLVPPTPRRWPYALGAGIAAALLLWALFPSSPAPVEAPPEPALVSTSALSVPVPAAAVAPEVKAPAAPETAAPPEVAPPAARDNPPAPPAATLAKPAPEASARPGPCGAEPGQLLGYWYAGERSPGSKGEVVTLSNSVRVRAAYPTADNGYRVDGAIRCHLSAGTRQRLSAAPLHIPGDAFWVPVHGGDVL